MNSYSEPKQQLLPGIEQAQCACGCGQWFMRVRRGRTRLYVNETHKKRVMRAKRKERASEGQIKLTPKGWLYFLEKDDDKLNSMWVGLTDDEREVITAMCHTTMTPERFVDALLALFTTTKSYRRLQAEKPAEWTSIEL